MDETEKQIAKAVKEAIEKLGVKEFKKTSLFLSNHR